ncbi:hypothetical protein NLJ89_g2957 [Agrocybe chaxingu]|uniref:Uncharacterized protein n=1 Tax=Agrocybe chaxingu TaxID=84603 RepID=A0A9W8KBQ6_9AGAR|nr:hypothetical protein NLJ89_g2957 [Agrocybe chaxingu]
MFAQRCLLAALVLFASLAASAPIAGYSSDTELLAREPVKSTVKQMTHAVKMAKKLKESIHPKPNSAVFWSGTKTNKKGETVSVKQDAQRFAKYHGKETLNQALKKANIHIPTEKQNPHSPRLWNIASKLMAQRAKGETHAILGGNVRPQSVWKKTEKPALMKNDQVTKVTEHNKGTKEKTVTK